MIFSRLKKNLRHSAEFVRLVGAINVIIIGEQKSDIG